MMLIRIRNLVSRFLIFIVLGVMIFLIGKVQTNIINSVLYLLNILLISFLAKGDSKPSTLKNQSNITRSIKLFSEIVLLIDILMLCFLQMSEVKPIPGSFDESFRNALPLIYNNLDYIGFKLFITQSKLSSMSETEQEALINTQMKFKFYTLVAYYMIAIYMTQYFKTKKNEIEDEIAFVEKDYNKLFEFDFSTFSKEEDPEEKE